MSTIDINKLTMGEIALVEELSNAPIQTLSDEAAPKGLALAALAFVAKRREDPAFTWNDAQALTMTDVTELLGLSEPVAEEPAPSQEPAPKAASSRRTK